MLKSNATMQSNSAIFYSALSFLAFVLFHWLVRPEELDLGNLVFIAYFLGVVFSAIFGWFFGTWYCTTDGEKPNFEFILAPILVYVCATFASGCIFGLVLFAANFFSTGKLALIEGLLAGLFGGFVCLYLISPVVLPLSIIGGYILYKKS